MIKYLGSKRRLVPVLGDICRGRGRAPRLDLFTGTTRVAQEFKRQGAHVTAVDTRALRRGVRAVLRRARRRRRSTATRSPTRSPISWRVPTSTATSPRRSAAGRGSSSRTTAGASTRSATRSSATTAASWLYPVLLTSLLEAADRVDSTTGVQMAYVKQWAPRSYTAARAARAGAARGRGRGGAGRRVRGRGRARARSTSPTSTRRTTSTATSRTTTCGRRWSRGTRPSTTAWRASASTRAIRRRRACSTTGGRCPTRSRRSSRDVDADLVVVSYNDESWVAIDELEAMCAARGGEVRTLEFDSRRYVGAADRHPQPRRREGRDGLARAQRRVRRVCR